MNVLFTADRTHAFFKIDNSKLLCISEKLTRETFLAFRLSEKIMKHDKYFDFSIVVMYIVNSLCRPYKWYTLNNIQGSDRDINTSSFNQKDPTMSATYMYATSPVNTGLRYY